MIKEELIKQISGRIEVAHDLVSNLYHNLNELNGTIENIEYLKYLLEKIKNNEI